jgi:hypothetical protein
VQPVSVWRECADRRGALEAIGIGILAREFTLPGICHVTAGRREFIAPRKFGVREPAARREFPFRFGWQILASPFGVGERIAEGHMHDRMIVQPADVASGSVRMPPLRALGEGPPLAEVSKTDRMRGGREHQRARIDHVREHSRIILGIGYDLRDGDVLGGPYELPELPVRHRIAVHPKTVHRDTVRRRFFGIMLVRSHAESATWNPDHPVRMRGVVISPDISLSSGRREQRRHVTPR